MNSSVSNKRRFSLWAVRRETRRGPRCLCVASLILVALADSAANSVRASESVGTSLRIAVSANFAGTAERLIRDFEHVSNVEASLSIASTGVLVTQASMGAPFDVLLAADVAGPARLAQHNSATGAPFCYARGKLALVGGQLADLADNRHSVAIANPTTAPYGRAAVEVLRRSEFSGGSARKLVRGNNVLQAYQYWQSGNTRLALVALSLAPEGRVIPAEWHQSLQQDGVILGRAAANPNAVEFVNYLRSDPAQSIIAAAGYDPC